MHSYPPDAPISTVPDANLSAFAASWKIRLKEPRAHPCASETWPRCLGAEALSTDALLELRQRRLDLLVADAATNVPFYIEWAKSSGFRPGDRAQIGTLPVLDKAPYRLNLEAFQSRRFPLSHMRSAKTSGSSGQPFRFRTHPLSMDQGYCGLWRGLRRFRLRPGMRRLYVWGRSWVYGAGLFERIRRRARSAVRDWANQTLSIPAYDLSDRNVARAVDRLITFKPEYVHGYVSALYVLARHVIESDRIRAVPPLRAVITESEKLYDFQRTALRQAFGCPVVEQYGSVGFGNIAGEDPEGNLRVSDDMFWLESLDDGQAVITNLASFAFPFIRFRLGDLIEFREDIPAGLPFRVLARVTGRTLDLFPRPGGGHVHGMALAHVVDPHLAFVRRYQFHQTAIDYLVVKLQPAASSIPSSVHDRMRADLQALFGPITIVFESVQEILPMESGKYRWVRSDVAGSTAP